MSVSQLLDSTGTPNDKPWANVTCNSLACNILTVDTLDISGNLLVGGSIGIPSQPVGSGIYLNGTSPATQLNNYQEFTSSGVAFGPIPNTNITATFRKIGKIATVFFPRLVVNGNNQNQAINFTVTFPPSFAPVSAGGNVLFAINVWDNGIRGLGYVNILSGGSIAIGSGPSSTQFTASNFPTGFESFAYTYPTSS